MQRDRAERSPIPFLGLAVGLIAMLWAFWGSFINMSVEWERQPEYSHGYLVPLIALALIWFRQDQIDMGQPRMSRLGIGLFIGGIVAFFVLPFAVSVDWGFIFAGTSIVGAGICLAPEKPDFQKFQPTWWGMPLLLGGIGLRLFATYYYIEWFDQLSIIPCVAGLVLLTVGWPAIRWCWPAVLFLGFMVPLPHSLERMLRSPLRKVGTKASTYLMQTCGLPAFADGNQHEIMVGGMTHRIGVTEACSGLSMLMIFFALSTAVALIIRRPLWDKLIVLASAVPIALIANITRISITGMMLYMLEGQDFYIGIGGWTLFEMPGTEFANTFFHDWAGWLMMPMALILMWIELELLKRLVIIEEDVPLTVATRNAENERPNNSDIPSSNGVANSSEKTGTLLHGAK